MVEEDITRNSGEYLLFIIDTYLNLSYAIAAFVALAPRPLKVPATPNSWQRKWP